jgi:hypothetical protein
MCLQFVIAVFEPIDKFYEFFRLSASLEVHSRETSVETVLPKVHIDVGDFAVICRQFVHLVFHHIKIDVRDSHSILQLAFLFYRQLGVPRPQVERQYDNLVGLELCQYVVFVVLVDVFLSGCPVEKLEQHLSCGFADLVPHDCHALYVAVSGIEGLLYVLL